MPRLLIMMAAIVASAGVLDARSQARAEIDYPYCLATNGYAEGRCYYSTLEQCRAPRRPAATASTTRSIPLAQIRPPAALARAAAKTE